MQSKLLSLAFGSSHPSFKACLGQETGVGAAFLLLSFQNHNQLGMSVCVLMSPKRFLPDRGVVIYQVTLLFIVLALGTLKDLQSPNNN